MGFSERSFNIPRFPLHDFIGTLKVTGDHFKEPLVSMPKMEETAY